VGGSEIVDWAAYGFVSRPWPTQALGMMADGAIASRARAVKPRGRSRALHIYLPRALNRCVHS